MHWTIFDYKLEYINGSIDIRVGAEIFQIKRLKKKKKKKGQNKYMNLWTDFKYFWYLNNYNLFQNMKDCVP